MVTNGNEICKKGVYLRKRESIENEKIIAIFYHIPVMIVIFCRLRGIGFFGQDEPNWIFLNLKRANFVFFELKKLSCPVTSVPPFVKSTESSPQDLVPFLFALNSLFYNELQQFQ